MNIVRTGMRRHGSPQELERVRREAVALRAQGVSCVQIAKALDRSVRTVYAWVAKARQRGGEALAAKPHAGARPKLTAQQRNGLRWPPLQHAYAGKHTKDDDRGGEPPCGRGTLGARPDRDSVRAVAIRRS